MNWVRPIEAWRENDADVVVFRASGCMVARDSAQWPEEGGWSEPVQYRFVRLPSGQWEMELREI